MWKYSFFVIKLIGKYRVGSYYFSTTVIVQFQIRYCFNYKVVFYSIWEQMLTFSISFQVLLEINNIKN